MCPFVNKADRRCSAHMAFSNLFSAYAHCADRYASCRVFEQLERELSNDYCCYTDRDVRGGVVCS